MARRNRLLLRNPRRRRTRCLHLRPRPLSWPATPQPPQRRAQRPPPLGQQPNPRLRLWLSPTNPPRPRRKLLSLKSPVRPDGIRIRRRSRQKRNERTRIVRRCIGNAPQVKRGKLARGNAYRPDHLRRTRLLAAHHCPLADGAECAHVHPAEWRTVAPLCRRCLRRRYCGAVAARSAFSRPRAFTFHVAANFLSMPRRGNGAVGARPLASCLPAAAERALA